MGGFDFSGLNAACLGAFGQDLTFRRVQSGSDSLTVNGILDSGVELESRLPGDGSAYARLWLRSADIDPAPVPGDEIEGATTVYKIVLIEKDAAGGLMLLLRLDRAVA